MSITAALKQVPAASLIKADGGEFFEKMGDMVRIIVSGAQTGGQLAIGELSATAGFGPPPHIHPQSELFYITEGLIEFGIGVDGVWQTATKGPGTMVYIPGGAPHCFRGAAPESRFIGAVWDASLEGFFREAGVQRAHWRDRGGYDEARVPFMLESLARHGVELIDTANPPLGEPVQLWDMDAVQPGRLQNLVVRLGLRGSAGRGTTAFEVWQAPGPAAPPVCQDSAKALVVIDGAFEFTTVAGGARQVLRGAAGDTLFVPAGAPHNYRNALERPGRLLVIAHPDGAQGLEGLIDAAAVPMATVDEALAAPAVAVDPQQTALRPTLERFGMRVYEE